MVRDLDIEEEVVGATRSFGIVASLVAFAMVLSACGDKDDEAGTAADTTAQPEVSEDLEESEDSWEGVGEGLPEPPPAEEDNLEAEIELDAPEGALRNGALLLWLEGHATCHEDFDPVEMPLAGEVDGDGWHIEYYPDVTDSGEDGMRVRATGNASLYAGIISQDGTTSVSIMKPLADSDIDNVSGVLDVLGGPGNWDGDTVTFCHPE